MTDILILLAAAFGAGVLNTIAGGGTFLTFPALVFTGVPPVVANATSAVAVFPGYLGGALGFRTELASGIRPPAGGCPVPPGFPIVDIFSGDNALPPEGS